MVPEAVKVCPHCKQQKPKTTEFFSPRKSRGPNAFNSWCRACERMRNTENQGMRRKEVLRVYGGKCACCGESHPSFLGIDHIDGNGNQHRRTHTNGRAGDAFYRWLKKYDYPNGFRILCWNCNMARGFFGRCPHES